MTGSGTRWVDLNEGDEKNPNYRSSIAPRNLILKEMICSQLLLLEAIIILLSCAVTRGVG